MHKQSWTYRPHVLLAEDDPHLRAQIARSIRELGWDVTEAADGREVLALLDGNAALEHALLVTDVRMPEFDGIDLLAELSVRRHRLRTVVITAFADEHIRQMARALGASVVFSKPFDVDDLCTALLSIAWDGR